MLDQTSVGVHQRAAGDARVAFDADGRLSDLYQRGCAKVMLPRSHTDDPQAIFINTSGGLTGGDHVSYRVSTRRDGAATAATQTAERVYRSVSGAARMDVALDVAQGARLDWLPQETILFEGSALERVTEVDLAADAQLLMCEAVVFGRIAMGEDPQSVDLKDTWRIRRKGRLLHTEAVRISGDLCDLRAGPGALGRCRAIATILYVGADAEDRIDALRALPDLPGIRRAASAWQGRLVVRFAADAPQYLRPALVDCLSRLRGRPLPRVWTM